jgi:hypothetical protein
MEIMHQFNFTTRKLEKSNGIIDENIPSVINTDGHHSVSKSVGIYRRNHSVGNSIGIYRQNISIGIYRPISPTEYTFRLEIRNGMVTSGYFTDGNTEGFKL